MAQASCVCFSLHLNNAQSGSASPAVMRENDGASNHTWSEKLVMDGGQSISLSIPESERAKEKDGDRMRIILAPMSHRSPLSSPCAQ